MAIPGSSSGSRKTIDKARAGHEDDKTSLILNKVSPVPILKRKTKLHSKTESISKIPNSQDNINLQKHKKPKMNKHKLISRNKPRAKTHLILKAVQRCLLFLMIAMMTWKIGMKISMLGVVRTITTNSED